MDWHRVAHILAKAGAGDPQEGTTKIMQWKSCDQMHTSAAYSILLVSSSGLRANAVLELIQIDTRACKKSTDMMMGLSMLVHDPQSPQT